MEHIKRLATTWDRVISFYPDADLSRVKKVFIDDISHNINSIACHYDGHIVVSPKAFQVKQYSSPYIHEVVPMDDVFEGILHHELLHHLIEIGFIPFDGTMEEEEVFIEQKIKRFYTPIFRR